MAKLTSTSANEIFNGALGNDILIFNGTLQSYILDVTGGIFTVDDTDAVASGDDGTDTVSGFEKLTFVGNQKQVLMSQEAVVNINTKGEQTQTAMLATSTGGFYSFWASGANQTAGDDGDDGTGYYFRTFDTDGIGSGVDLRLLKGVAAGVQQAVFADDSFVLVWAETDGSGTGVYTQIFNPDGTAKFEKFRVNDTITDNQYSPSVAVTSQSGADTGFVVVWQSDNQGDSIYNGASMGDAPNSAGIFMQKFDMSANPTGYETKVGPSGGGNPFVSAFDDGGFVVTYEALESSTAVRDIVLSSIFDADGNESYLGQINSDYVFDTEEPEGSTQNELRSEPKLPKVAVLNNGNIVYTWQAPVDGYTVTSGNINFDRSILFKIVDNNGTDVTTELKANTDNFINVVTSKTLDKYEQAQPEIAALQGPGGGFVIVWQSMLDDQSYWGVYAQMFNSDGTKNGSEFLVNTKTADSQKNPNVVALADGSFVISWEGEYQDGIQQGLFQEGTAGTEIVMQRYDLTGAKLGASFAGTAAADTLTISGSDPVELDGAAGNDTLTTSLGDDTVRGGLGDDSITSGVGNDILIGGDGKDVFISGEGDDSIFGGEGSDKLILTGASTDYTIVGGNGNYVITDNRTTGILDGEDSIVDVEVVKFTDKEISLAGNTSGGSGGGASNGLSLVGTASVADVLNGGDDNDTLQGGGNNIGIAIDTMQGGDGDDTYIVTGTSGVIYDTDGIDTLQIGMTVDLTKIAIGKFNGFQYIENVTLQGTKALKLTGNSTDNQLIGNDGANTIKADLGDDTLAGGLGKDVLTGGAGDDIFVFDSTVSKANIDKITDFGNGVDTIRLAEAFFSDLDPDENGEINFISGKGIKAAGTNEVSFIVYDTKGGGLYYDAAHAAPILFATLSKVNGAIPDLQAIDFDLI